MLHIVQTGNGPDLVLLHGWGLNGKVWDPITPLLSQHFRLTVIDLPGHGNSPLDSEFTLDNIVESLQPVIPENATLLGWSLGGSISIAFIKKYPHQINKLILLASNPCFVSTNECPTGMAPDTLEQFGKNLVEDYTGTIRKFLATCTLDVVDGASLLKRLVRNMDSVPVPNIDALLGGVNILRDANLWPALKNISCPTLAILGKRDMLVPVRIEKDFRSHVKNIQMKIFESAGHGPFMSHPEEFMETIRDFAA